MTDRETFIRAICEQPADDTVRLVFADWLEEHGERDRGEFIRVQIGLEKYRGQPSGGIREYDELSTRERELFHRAGSPGFFDDLEGKYRTTEAVNMTITTADGITYTVRRGFVSAVELYCSLFTADGFAARLFAREPVTSVKPSDVTAGRDILSNRWYLTASAGSVSDLDKILDTIPGARCEGGYPSAESRLDAFSAALVAFGRKQANLPLWEPQRVSA